METIRQIADNVTSEPFWFWRWLIDGMSAFVVMIGLSNTIGYLFMSQRAGENWFVSVGTGMSFQTGFCFLLLGMVQLLRSRNGRKCNQCR